MSAAGKQSSLKKQPSKGAKTRTKRGGAPKRVHKPNILPRLTQKCSEEAGDQSVLNTNLCATNTDIFISAALYEKCVTSSAPTPLVKLSPITMYALTAKLGDTRIPLEDLIEMGLRIHAKNPDFKLQDGVTRVVERIRSATGVQYNFVFANELFLFELTTMHGPAVTLCFQSDN
jgi:hypothetical protein